jgi:hypothetical protein
LAGLEYVQRSIDQGSAFETNRSLRRRMAF